MPRDGSMYGRHTMAVVLLHEEKKYTQQRQIFRLKLPKRVIVLTALGAAPAF